MKNLKHISFKIQRIFVFKTIFLIIIILYFLIRYKNLLINFELKDYLIIKPFREKQINSLTKFLGYKKLIKLEKEKLLEFISKNVGKNIKVVKSIFLGQNFHFGNQLRLIYKAIFYCEIISCRKIILDRNHNWYIKNKIINKKYKMIIVAKNIYDVNKYDTIIDNTYNFFHYSKFLSPKFNINLLKKEIIKNLPKIFINQKDLCIYIRSGDIFQNPHHLYKQPPLCFYQKVLDNYLFKNVYLISENKNNPVINELLTNFPNIIYNFNSLKNDISYLVNAYNIVGGGFSTFFSRMKELNNNLLFLWTFIFTRLPFNQHLKFNIISFYNIKKRKIFLLYASNNYIKKMKYWRNSKEQRDLMIKEECTNQFFLI